MAETATLLCDEVFPAVPLRQWVISFPFAPRFLFATRPQAMTETLGIVYRTLATHLAHQAGCYGNDVAAGAVTLITALRLRLNIHFHLLTIGSCVPWYRPISRRCHMRSTFTSEWPMVLDG